MILKLVKHRKFYRIEEFFEIASIDLVNKMKKLEWEADYKIFLKNKKETKELKRLKNHNLQFDYKIDKYFF